MTGEVVAFLLTWTTYGTWLPGDDRGFVGYVREGNTSDGEKADEAGHSCARVIHNIPGTPYDKALPRLQHYAREQMRGEPVWLTTAQAETFLKEAHRTADFQHWHLLAVAVMANHIHLVVLVPDDLTGERLLQEFKSYGSRALNKQFGKPESGTWWTKSGSARWLPSELAVTSAVEYVRHQQRPLVIWFSNANPSTGVDGSKFGVDGSK